MKNTLSRLCASALACSLVVIAAPPAGAETITIDFESDSVGAKPNGFASVGDPRVTFTDTSGAGLDVGSFGVQSDGQGMRIRGDDSSALQIDLADGASSVSLDFGNDDPAWLDAGDVASLVLLDSDGAELASETVATNNNDVMDQTITATVPGSTFAMRAVFQFQNADRTPEDLTEIVDNVVVETAEAVCDDEVDNDNDGDTDLDDSDCSRPLLSLEDASVTEGDSGAVDLVFPVALSEAFDTSDIEVSYGITSGTADADDFAGATSGAITIVAGETSGEIVIAVQGDTVAEPDETLVLGISVTSTGPYGPAIPETGPTGTIVNDDEMTTAVDDADADESGAGETPPARPTVANPDFTG